MVTRDTTMTKESVVTTPTWRREYHSNELCRRGQEFPAHCPGLVDPLACEPNFAQPRVVYAINDFHQLFAANTRRMFVEQIDLARFVAEIVQHDPRFLIAKSVAPDSFQCFHCGCHYVASVLRGQHELYAAAVRVIRIVRGKRTGSQEDRNMPTILLLTAEFFRPARRIDILPGAYPAAA